MYITYYMGFLLITHLYFCCYYAFLQNNIQDCAMYYKFLKEEFQDRHGKHNLSLEQLRILKIIREAIRTGKIPNSLTWSDTSEIQNNLPSDQKTDQKQLVKEIILELNQIKNLLHSRGKLRLEGIEFPCGNFGVLDMFYLDDETVYPLEVKVNRGEDGLLNQILRYELFFKFRLHLNLFKKIKPVTLCANYQNFVLGELKKRNIITLKYSRENGKLKLYRI